MPDSTDTHKENRREGSRSHRGTPNVGFSILDATRDYRIG